MVEDSNQSNQAQDEERYIQLSVFTVERWILLRIRTGLQHAVLFLQFRLSFLVIDVMGHIITISRHRHFLDRTLHHKRHDAR